MARVYNMSGGGGSSKRTARIIIGTSTAGWTLNDCDYLCDGVSDQSQINSAIIALPSGGGEIVILDGEYNLSGRIFINSSSKNIMIRGNGTSTVLNREYESTNFLYSPFTFRNCTGKISLRDFRINGNKELYTNANNYGITAYDSIDICINNVTIESCHGSGIYISSSDYSESNIQIYDNICTNNGINGIRIGGYPENSYISNNLCTKNGENGIYISGSDASSHILNNNICKNNTYYGLYILYITSCVCSNNILTQNKAGLYISGSQKSVFSGNNCNDNNDGAIYMGASDYCTVTGNSCTIGNGTPSDYTSSQYTIQTLKASSNNLFVGNNIMGKNYIDTGTNNTWVNNKFE